MNRIELNNVTPFVAIPVGEVIKDELEARNMRQSELSRLMGVKAPILNDVIKGRRSLTPDMAILLEEIFEIPAKFFMDFQVQSELDSARINNRTAQQVKYLEIWKVIKEKIDIPSLKKSGVIKGEIIEDVKRIFKMFEVDSVEDLLCKIG